MTHDTRSDRIARRFEKPMLVAALLVLPTVVIETANAGPTLRSAAAVLNWAIWTAFAVELATMLAVVPRRRRWLRAHPLEVAIVLLTVPLWPAGLQAARLFRLARLLRLALVLRLARRLLAPGGLRFAAAIVGIAMLAGAAAFQAAERVHHHVVTLSDSLWWSISTMTTVGYGDVRAHTTLGRIIGVALMLVGTGFVALLTGAIAQRFVAEQSHRRHRAEPSEDPANHAILAELRHVGERLARLEAALGSRPEADIANVEP